MTATPDLVDRIDAALPQTQCTRCGYPDCRGYAHAIARGDADIDRCPPGGAEGIARLARLTDRPAKPLNADCGREGPRRLAIIDEAWCIGCTKCLDVCPVDCIVGAPKQMHTIIEPLCTGCELCIPVCPVDCISLEDATPLRTGWDAWTDEQARQAKQRYADKQARTARDRAEADARLAALAASRRQRQRPARVAPQAAAASDDAISASSPSA